MTCCKSTSSGAGAPTTAPVGIEPDIYIEQPSGQIWTFNGTTWVKPPLGAVFYTAETRVLTVGSSTVTLPVATGNSYGMVKVPVSGSPIVVDTAGNLNIDCTALISHCGLAKASDVPTQLTGAQIVTLLSGLNSTELSSLSGALLSPDSGNQLQARSNGLYYGVEAAPDVANLYVSNSGSDAATGTRADPLFTVAEAIKRQSTMTSCIINLEEGGIFYLKSSDFTADPSSSIGIKFYPYGTTCDVVGATVNAVGVALEACADYPRPTLVLVCDTTFTLGSTTYSHPAVLSQTEASPSGIRFFGINIDSTDTSPNGSIGAPSNSFIGSTAFRDYPTGRFVFAGCALKLGAQYHLVSVSGSSNISFEECNLNKTTGSLLAAAPIQGVMELAVQQRYNGGSIAGTPYSYFTTSPSSEYTGLVNNSTVSAFNVISTSYTN